MSAPLLSPPATGSFGPLLAAAPFGAILLAIALGPVLLPKLWHRPLAQLALLLGLAAPAAVADGLACPARLLHAIDEYASFVLLLAALYQLAAGIVLAGPFTGRPTSNAGLLLAGAVGANCIGTTGASMLLLPPFLRANAGRRHSAHLVVFFIFIVSNLGGLLTPLGDPPLFLGYLHGVPFLWTLGLWPQWLAGLGLLVPLFWLLDFWLWRSEPAEVAANAAARSAAKWRCQGAGHALGLCLVVALLAIGPGLHIGPHWQQGALAAFAIAAWYFTPAATALHNRVTLAPLIEVAVLFLPLFLAMPQALGALVKGPQVALIRSPETFFWATGALSSVLDNAPCYVAFAAMAAAQQGCSPAHLAALAAHPVGAAKLAAIAHGAVSMGAMTYIGNGPNLMVRHAAQAAGARPPTFAGYLGWSLGVLLPILWLVRRMTT